MLDTIENLAIPGMKIRLKDDFDPSLGIDRWYIFDLDTRQFHYPSRNDGSNGNLIDKIEIIETDDERLEIQSAQGELNGFIAPEDAYEFLFRLYENIHSHEGSVSWYSFVEALEGHPIFISTPTSSAVMVAFHANDFKLNDNGRVVQSPTEQL